MTLLRFLCVSLFFGLFGLSSGLYFHIAETERKCFIEEIPDETMVTGDTFLHSKIQGNFIGP
jgi:hypothetical protein